MNQRLQFQARDPSILPCSVTHIDGAGPHTISSRREQPPVGASITTEDMELVPPFSENLLLWPPAQDAEAARQFDSFQPYITHDSESSVLCSSPIQISRTRSIPPAFDKPLSASKSSEEKFRLPFQVSSFLPTMVGTEPEEYTTESCLVMSKGDLFSKFLRFTDGFDVPNEICPSFLPPLHESCHPDSYDMDVGGGSRGNPVLQDLPMDLPRNLHPYFPKDLRLDQIFWTGVHNEISMMGELDVNFDHRISNHPPIASPESLESLAHFELKEGVYLPTVRSQSHSEGTEIHMKLTSPQRPIRTSSKATEKMNYGDSQYTELKCGNCCAVSTDVFRRSDDVIRCERCATYHRRHHFERPDSVIAKEPKHIPRECVNCSTTTSRQWRRGHDHGFLCSECDNYQRRTGRPRPLHLAMKYLAKKDIIGSRRRKPRRTHRFKKKDRFCTNCQARESRGWYGGSDGGCICAPCWLFWYRTKKDRPRRLWG